MMSGIWFNDRNVSSEVFGASFVTHFKLPNEPRPLQIDGVLASTEIALVSWASAAPSTLSATRTSPMLQL